MSAAPPTLKPKTSKHHVNVFLQMAWEGFCQIDSEFKEIIARLLSNETKTPYSSHQVVFLNKENCENNPKDKAAVSFYISKLEEKKTPDKRSTQLVFSLLKNLTKDGKGTEFGKFTGKVCKYSLISLSIIRNTDM